MAEKLSGFEMVMSNNDFVSLGCRAIAHLAEMKPDEVVPSEINILSHARLARATGRISRTEQFALAYLSKKYEPKRRLSERTYDEVHQSIGQTVELVSGCPTFLNSYGIYAPSYNRELEKQKEEYDDPNYRSLLVGAYTPETAIEYTATVKSVFPQAKTAIVDLKGVNIHDKPNFVFADGLHTPFVNNAFSSIHTNYLLHMLEGGKTDSRVNVIRFFKETFRILKPRGKLVLCEGHLDYVKSNRFSIQEMLINCGFSLVETKPALAYVNRREMVRHFRSTHGAKDEQIEEYNNPCIFVATKR